DVAALWQEKPPEIAATVPPAPKPTEPSSLPTLRHADNGVPSRTLRPAGSEGYVIAGKTYISNASSCELSPADRTGDLPDCPTDGPQVLIVHTHATESYTMPAGEEYVPSDEWRTLEEDKNMLRIGDEMAAVLTEQGLSVLHDRTLHDYPNYSGAYNRSLATVERYLEQYPSILYVLDVHRDAVEDEKGQSYKLLCAEEPRAAQMEFVLGTPGGGAAHENWKENLKLACAVQETVLADYPTLMRPIIVRNSRYNQHLTPGSLLIEVGTAGNSLDEALTSARIFAEGFAKTVLE
ncbi:MAG: stage II sporulation protein P, partial [Oscillospiraceae bacterium]|nr:stage II sporulation protein P [Oscillospiraceae bacterium]